MSEQEFISQYNIDFDSAQAVVIGDGSTLVQQLSEQVLIQESLADVLSDTFIPPSQGDRLASILLQHNLLILCGANRMGKASLARYVASRIQSDQASGNVFRLRRHSEFQDLVDVVDKQPRSIILVYDAKPFEAEDIMPVVREMARRVASFVIVTCDASTENWHIPMECSDCLVQVTQDFPYTRRDLEQLLRNQLGERLAVLEKQGFSVHSLVQNLHSPSQIVRFADLLSVRTEPFDADQVREWIDLAQDVRLEIGRWFRNLDKNERYLALTLALLDDLPEKNFWSIYEQMVRAWQERDFTLLPLDYYALEVFKPFVSLGSRIGFREMDYRQAVLNMFLAQYRRSLVAALTLLRQAAITYSKDRDDADKTTRFAIARSVGQIGAVEWGESEQVLLTWAMHTWSRVRAATGHAFQQLLENVGNENLPDVLNKLDSWITRYSFSSQEPEPSDSTNVRWAVASSLGRLARLVPQSSFRDDILPRLQTLSWDDKYQVRVSAVYTLRSLGVSWFPDIRQILIERAADWHPAVRFEVAQVVARLSTTRQDDVLWLFRQWLTGEKEERRWTALLMCMVDASFVGELYVLTDQSDESRSRVQTSILKLVEELNSSDKHSQGVVLLESLIRNDEPGGSYLVIPILVYTIDWRYPLVEERVLSWQNSDRLELRQAAGVVLSELERLRTDRRRRWQILLKHYLDDTKELYAFAGTLPPDEKKAFIHDVRTKRKAIKQEALIQEQQKRKAQTRSRCRAITIAIIAFLLLCCASCSLCVLLDSFRALFL